MRRDNKNKQKKKKKRIGKTVIVLILILMIGLGAFLGYSIQKNGGGIQGLLATLLGQNAEELQNVGTINVLVLRS